MTLSPFFICYIFLKSITIFNKTKTVTVDLFILLFIRRYYDVSERGNIYRNVGMSFEICKENAINYNG